VEQSVRRGVARGVGVESSVVLVVERVDNGLGVRDGLVLHGVDAPYHG
jgi:hypothetical protein